MSGTEHVSLQDLASSKAMQVSVDLLPIVPPYGTVLSEDL